MNPNGKTLAALAALDTAQEQSNATIKIVAKWIGEARRRSAVLTDMHENELYDYLILNGGYNQIKNEIAFLTKINDVILKRSTFGVFDQTQPLNLANLTQKTPTEQNYDAQLRELQSSISELEKYIKTRQTNLAARGASEAQILKITEGDMATLARKRKQYAELMQAKGRIMEQAGKEMSLFENVRGFKNRVTNKSRIGATTNINSCFMASFVNAHGN